MVLGRISFKMKYLDYINNLTNTLLCNFVYRIIAFLPRERMSYNSDLGLSSDSIVKTGNF